MLHDFIQAAMSVQSGILEQLTQLPVAQPLPDHRLMRSRQMPAGSPGRHVLSFKIMVLMAGAAFHPGDALSIHTAPDVHRVPVSIVSLPGKISAGMAIHTTPMPEHRHDRFKRRRGRSLIACRASRQMLPIFLLGSRVERPLTDQAARYKCKH